MYEGRPRAVEFASQANQSPDFDLVMPTMLGLLEDLVPGTEIMNEFLVEFEKCTDPSYGDFFVYPSKAKTVRFAPRRWHQLALFVRNALLIRDPAMILSWHEIRAIFDRAVVAVTGCSVGNNAAHAIVRDIRPGQIKIADPKDYHLTNANRVHLTFEDFGRNKALVTAEQIHAVDPYIRVSPYSEGAHQGNLDDFLEGVTLLVEECDDIDTKITIREKARVLGIPVLMVTDLGSAAQLDVRRFDLDRSLPIAACGVSDEEIYSIQERCRKDPNRENFYDFVFAIVGKNHIYTPEFKVLAFKEEPPVFGGVPQLGSTAMMAGGMVAEAAARLMLGFDLPERMFINKFTGKVIFEGRRM